VGVRVPHHGVVGPIDDAALLGGLAMQALWIAVGAALVAVVWRAGIRRYAAVGG
jgi:ABC-2 type transport system permease protein